MMQFCTSSCVDSKWCHILGNMHLVSMSPKSFLTDSKSFKDKRMKYCSVKRNNIFQEKASSLGAEKTI